MRKFFDTVFLEIMPAGIFALGIYTLSLPQIPLVSERLALLSIASGAILLFAAFHAKRQNNEWRRKRREEKAQAPRYAKIYKTHSSWHLRN